jgi:hypothetical protein
MIPNAVQNINYEVCRNNNDCIQIICTVPGSQIQTAQSASTSTNMTCKNNNNEVVRMPAELLAPHQVDPNCNTDTCEMQICTLDGNKLTCTPYVPQAEFTNVKGFKSKKGRNVEKFSQNTNGKCKARY